MSKFTCIGLMSILTFAIVVCTYLPDAHSADVLTCWFGIYFINISKWTAFFFLSFESVCKWNESILTSNIVLRQYLPPLPSTY